MLLAKWNIFRISGWSGKSITFWDFRDGIYLYFSITPSLNCWTKFELILLILILGVRGCVFYE
jgi:hypothetical protein